MLRAESPFYIDKERAIYSIEELIDILKDMDDEFYTFFVNKDKNDFSNWIKHSFHLPMLANRIRFKNKINTIKILEDFIGAKEERKDNIERTRVTEDKQIYQIKNGNKEQTKEKNAKKEEPKSIMIEDSIKNTREQIDLGIFSDIEKDKIDRISREINNEARKIEKENKELECADISYLQEEYEKKKRELENYQKNLELLKRENKQLTTEYIKLKEKEHFIEKLEREAKEKLHKASLLLHKAEEHISRKDIPKEEMKFLKDNNETIQKSSNKLNPRILSQEDLIKDIPEEKELVEDIEIENKEDWEDIIKLEKEIDKLIKG